MKSDIVGLKTGLLTVSPETEIKGKCKLFKCVCECGNVRYHTKQNILRGTLRSCGCLRASNFGKRHKNWHGAGEISLTFFSRLKNLARVRKIKFDVKINELEELRKSQNGMCALTGEKLLFPQRSNDTYGVNKTASLDRIDSKKPYVKDNIQWVHKDINMMKQQFNQDYFLELCSKVHNFKSNK